VLFHVSIPADDPEHVARVVAEIWHASVLPFPPVPGAYMVWLGDERRTVLEVNPRGSEHVPAPGEFGIRSNPAASPHSEAHVAIGMPMSADEALAIGKREGWLAQRSNRGGLFEVVELWVENRFLLELLTDDEQQRYVDNMTLDKLRELFGPDSSR